MRESIESKPKSNGTGRDAISPDVFSKDELYEINDAINEVVGRMLRDGQTPTEIKYHSLGNLWTAWQRVTLAVCGTTNTPGMEDISPKIAIAIAHPKTLNQPTRY